MFRRTNYEEFRATVLRANADCTDLTMEKNEALAIKNANYKGVFGVDLGDYQISGKLVKDLFRCFTKSGVRELLGMKFSETPEESEKEMNSLGLAPENTIRDMMDRIPLYASAVVTIRKMVDGTVEEYELALNRRGKDQNGLEEYRVINFILTAYECGPIEE